MESEILKEKNPKKQKKKNNRIKTDPQKIPSKIKLFLSSWIFIANRSLIVKRNPF